MRRAALIAAAIAAASAAPWPPRSIADLRAAVATSARDAPGCVLFLHAGGQAGCASGAQPSPSPVAAAIPAHNVSRPVVVISGAGDDTATIAALRADPAAAARVAGVVALPGDPPAGPWSPDECNPQAGGGRCRGMVAWREASAGSRPPSPLALSFPG